MKKLLALILCAMMLLTSAAAVAEGANIVWAGWSGEEEATKDIFQKMMDTYEAETGNTVTWVGWTWADTAQQLLIRVQGGEQLDIAQTDISIFNTVAQAGVLADWTEILGEDYLKENFEEAALASGRIPVFPVGTLRDAADFFQGKPMLPCRTAVADGTAGDGNLPDFSEVKGQVMARRAMEIAAAGSHNVLMSGPPGTGKSLISSCLPGILPPMTLEETLETSRIHSVLGLLEPGKPLVNRRPFVAPHHTASDVGLIGGGKNPTPGEISRAHNGVLFLDELPEFKRNVLEVLRQPLETGSVSISRANGSCTFPAKFILIAAMNPCPCGRGDYELGCTCKPDEKRRYRKKISGPLLDRIDLHVEVRQLTQEELLKSPDGESSAAIRERVIAARRIQEERFRDRNFHANGQMTGRDLQKHCRIAPAGQLLLRQAIARFKLSPRAYDRILKVARTIADLAQSESIQESHLFEAIGYRGSERIDA